MLGLLGNVDSKWHTLKLLLQLLSKLNKIIDLIFYIINHWIFYKAFDF
jgi:hypothetical protein